MRALIKKNLLGLPVFTRSGAALGKLMDVELDVEAHLVMSYHVRTSQLLPGFLSKQIVVGREQVVSITAEKIIVEDTIIKESSTARAWGEGLAAPSASIEGGNLAVKE